MFLYRTIKQEQNTILSKATEQSMATTLPAVKNLSDSIASKNIAFTEKEPNFSSYFSFNVKYMSC